MYRDSGEATLASGKGASKDQQLLREAQSHVQPIIITDATKPARSAHWLLTMHWTPVPGFMAPISPVIL